MNGKADDRIKEDLLRIMRVYRFAANLKFEIDKKTLIACRKHFNEMMIVYNSINLIKLVNYFILNKLRNK